MAKQHIETARVIAGSDPAGGLTLPYELSEGDPGAHAVARASGGKRRGWSREDRNVRGCGVPGHGDSGVLQMFDRVRQVRNRVQYDAFSVEDAGVALPSSGRSYLSRPWKLISGERTERPRPAALELLQRPARRRPVVRRLRRAAHVPALPEDGRRADRAAVQRGRRSCPRGSTGRRSSSRDGDELEVHYRHVLERARQGSRGCSASIFRKAQNRIQDPAKLRRLIVDLIDREKWIGARRRREGRRLRGAARRRTPRTRRRAPASTSRRGR